MTIHRIKLKDLNRAYLQELHKQYKDKDMEIEIHLPVSVSDSDRKKKMNEIFFWDIINLINWKTEEDDLVLAEAIRELATFSEKAILSFFDLLSQKLYLLDGRDYAIHSTNEKTFSADLFLYSRCYIIAKGQHFYHKVLKKPSTFPKDLFFERLLDLPHKAWQEKTSTPLKYFPKFIYETGFNPQGWGDQAISL